MSKRTMCKKTICNGKTTSWLLIFNQIWSVLLVSSRYNWRTIIIVSDKGNDGKWRFIIGSHYHALCIYLVWLGVTYYGFHYTTCTYLPCLYLYIYNNVLFFLLYKYIFIQLPPTYQENKNLWSPWLWFYRYHHPHSFFRIVISVYISVLFFSIKIRWGFSIEAC